MSVECPRTAKIIIIEQTDLHYKFKHVRTKKCPSSMLKQDYNCFLLRPMFLKLCETMAR